MNKKKSVKNSVYIMLFVLIAVLFLAAFLPAMYAYFTATANEKGTIQFGSIGINLFGGDGELLSSSSFKTNYLENIMPGSTINLNDIVVENSGTSDEYVLVNVDVSIEKSGLTTLTYNNWYNVEGIQVNVNDFAINSAEATLIEKGTSQIANIAWTFPGNALSNDYQGASATVTVGAYGVQTLLPEAEAYVSEPLYASYFICKKANEMPNKNIFSYKEAIAAHQQYIADGVRLSGASIVEYEGKTALRVQSTTLYDSNTRTGYYFPVNAKANTQYTLSFNAKLETVTSAQSSTYSVTGLTIMYSDGTKTNATIKNDNTIWQSVTKTSEAGKTVVGIGIYYDYNPWTNYADIMLEEGTTATEYVAHHSDLANSEITTEPLMKLATAEDSYDSLSQTVTRNVGKYEITGNETITYYPDKKLFYFSFLQNYVQGDINTAKNGNLICSHYDYKSAIWSSTIDEQAFLTNYPNFIVRDLNYSSVEDFKLYIQNEYNAGHPVTVWYQLADGKQTTQKAFPSKNLYEGSQFLHYKTGASDNNTTDVAKYEITDTATVEYLRNKTFTISSKVKTYADDKTYLVADKTKEGYYLYIDYLDSAGTKIANKYIKSIPTEGKDGKWIYSWCNNETILSEFSSEEEFNNVAKITMRFRACNTAEKFHFDVKDIQIEVGSSPTDFEANDPTVYAYAKGVALRQVGTVKDTYDATSGTITKNIGVYELTGDENWTGAIFNTSLNIYKWYTSITPAQVESTKNAVCSHATYSMVAADDNFYFGGSFNYITSKTLDEFTKYLADQQANGTPVTIWYELKIAQTI